jgi:hypothetical protein
MKMYCIHLRAIVVLIMGIGIAHKFT